MNIWKSSHNFPPEKDQEVYYFGHNIGIGIGKYHYEEREVNGTKLCPHIFVNNKFGVVDACDAPFWIPYDAEKAKGWCPIIPKEYTKGIYEND
jgi:hypothetical protein